jgi:hypothetical protein
MHFTVLKLGFQLPLTQELPDDPKIVYPCLHSYFICLFWPRLGIYGLKTKSAELPT